MRCLQGTVLCALTAALGSTGVGASVMLRAREEKKEENNGVYPPECHAEGQPIKPFCLPKNGTEVYTEDIYYGTEQHPLDVPTIQKYKNAGKTIITYNSNIKTVTWDSDAFPANSTITVGLNYANSSENAGVSAYTSERTENSYGFVTIKMDKIWLQEEPRNNLSVYIVEHNPNSEGRAKTIPGPTISLVNKPTKHYPPPPPTPVPNKEALAIGLPIGLGGFFLILLGLYFGMRKKRRIELGNIMGARNKGYGNGKSRIERLGGGRGRRGGAGVRLNELDDADAYRDEPRGGRMRSDAEIFNESERMRGNLFKGNVSRMKSWQ
ncbi:hypothetical protein AJ79_08927 [Helicocarpus griseus UAMH5409]|uniref:Mid2 domain-containing protein n=1 Tax=Helicocarpus griseus UAMH5409 TaxID=1447875 RepID=A0A2B7WP48_9EURO|nr:hypothetical protein AJ79_08927 [Helicocarpus griseus UAMH5409]